MARCKPHARKSTWSRAHQHLARRFRPMHLPVPPPPPRRRSPRLLHREMVDREARIQELQRMVEFHHFMLCLLRSWNLYHGRTVGRVIAPIEDPVLKRWMTAETGQHCSTFLALCRFHEQKRDEFYLRLSGLGVQYILDDPLNPRPIIERQNSSESEDYTSSSETPSDSE